MSIRLQCSINIQADTFPPPLRKTFSYPWIIITHEIEWSNSPALQLLLLHFELLLKVVHVAFFPLCVHTDYYSLGIPFFLGTRNFLPFDYKRHFPDFFPLLQFLFHRVLKHEKMCVISQSSLDCCFQVVGSYFFLLSCKKKVYGTSSSNPIL